MFTNPSLIKAEVQEKLLRKMKPVFSNVNERKVFSLKVK